MVGDGGLAEGGKRGSGLGAERDVKGCVSLDRNGGGKVRRAGIPGDGGFGGMIGLGIDERDHGSY